MSESENGHRGVRERELKFSTTHSGPPDEAELRAALTAAGFELGPARTVIVKDRYFDDARLSLSRAGVALRRRMMDGQMLATLKTRGTVSGALHDRDELEMPISDQEWPKPIYDRIAVLTAPGLLQARTIIETERHSHAVLVDGAPVATLAFDAVTARPQNGKRSVSFDEVEIEAHGSTGAETLEAIAAAVESVAPLTANPSSKLERARELLLLGDW